MISLYVPCLVDVWKQYPNLSPDVPLEPGTCKHEELCQLHGT
jgi:hypothetical protein